MLIWYEIALKLHRLYASAQQGEESISMSGKKYNKNYELYKGSRKAKEQLFQTH